MVSNISFITAFKKFIGLSEIIQKSTIYSWQINGIKTIIPREDDSPNLSIIEDVKRGPNQIPIFRDLIEKALPMIDTTMVAFINSDIMIEENFLQKCNQIFQKYGFDICIAGSRSNIRLNYLVDNPESYKKALAEQRLPYYDQTSSDIFITSKFIWRKILKGMPEFILEGCCWDSWLHSFAETNGLKRYNCTQAIALLHCDHPKLSKKIPGQPVRIDYWESIKI